MREDGRDVRWFLSIDPEEHARNKEQKRMLKFKIHTFHREIILEQQAYDKLLRGQERRKETYKPTYKTREELDAAYVAGLITDDKEYMRERYAIWQVYSDRGHINNLKWLHEQEDKYKKALEDLEAFAEEKNKESMLRSQKKRQKHKHHMAYKRRKRREKKKAELEARWKYYGIG